MLINKTVIEQFLNKSTLKKIDFFKVVKSINSTNTSLLDLSRSYYNPGSLAILIAEHQTSGRGREQRKWLDSPNQSILMSLLWQLPHPKNHHHNFLGLSLVIGMAIVTALKKSDMKEKVSIKWPNDIYFAGKKVGGILIESRSDIKRRLDNIVIGIGLNVKLTATFRQKITKPVTDLCDITQNQTLNRNQIIANILNQINFNLAKFNKHGFEYFYQKWTKFDALKDHAIAHYDTLNNNQISSGTAVGIDKNGNLRIRGAKGKIKTFISGSVEFI